LRRPPGGLTSRAATAASSTTRRLSTCSCSPPTIRSGQQARCERGERCLAASMQSGELRTVPVGRLLDCHRSHAIPTLKLGSRPCSPGPSGEPGTQAWGLNPHGPITMMYE
jgi:hypothetical protein